MALALIGKVRKHTLRTNYTGAQRSLLEQFLPWGLIITVLLTSSEAHYPAGLSSCKPFLGAFMAAQITVF